VSCPRLFEAEAARDGRLGDAERTAFARHAGACADCAREVQALEALAAALRVEGEADELRARRERTRLLASFDRALLAPARRPRWPWMLAPVALAGAAALLLRGRPTPVPAPATAAVVRAEGAAVWSDRREAGREEVLLERGALWIHVVHAADGGHVLVRLPDGELEDTGTTFTVRAEDGHTTRVAVEEGRVLLRIHGQPPVSLGAGEAWAPPASGEKIRQQADEWPASAAPSEPRPAPRAAPKSAPQADPSAEFREAMAAFDTGDARQAAGRFAAFVARHPADPRAEDASYLRVIALQRCEDREGLREAAADYLRRYPAGFRRAEVEAVTR
jgi:hypothetical protein